MSTGSNLKNKGFRKVSNRLKTAKGRRLSSTKWLTRHINDKYVILAKQNKYRSRAAFKLLEILEKFELITYDTKNIIDLGCAPGSWLQVLIRNCKKQNSKSKKPYKTKITGVDLQEMEQVEGANFIIGDFLDSSIQEQCIEFQDDGNVEKFDVILSDMAAQSCGNPQIDHLRIMLLAESVLEFACSNLNVGGHVVIKVLRGEQEHDFNKTLQKLFKKVKFFKPDASYKDSAEIYIVARFYKGIQNQN